MFNSFINNIPLVKEALNGILNQSLGFNIDLEQISIANGIELSFNNIEVAPNKLNELIFSGDNKRIKLRITKIAIKAFSLRLSASEYCIHVNGLSIVIMPISHLPLSEETPPKAQSTQSKPSYQRQQGLIDSILTYLLTRIEVKLEDINIHLLNYETTKKNIFFANPCLSIKIGRAVYMKGVCDMENETKSIFGNKMASIDNLSVLIEKNYHEHLESEPISLIGRDNAVIFTIDDNRAIKAYSNYSNEVNIELGVTQVIMNPLQVELLRNILTTYIELLQSAPQPSSHLKPQEIKHEATGPPFIDFSQFVVSFKCEGISMVLLENNYRSDLTKYYLFEADTEKLSSHFCYFEDNYYLLSLSRIEASVQQGSIKASMGKLHCFFIEYESKSLNDTFKKINMNEIVVVNDDVYASVYEDAETSIANNKDNNDCYHSVYESTNIYLENQIKYFNFKFTAHTIVDISSFKVEIENSLVVSLDSLKVTIHPIYMFKALKGLYANAILLNEILLFNYARKDKELSEELIEDYEAMDYLNINDELKGINKHTNDKSIKEHTLPSKKPIDFKLNMNEVSITVHAFERENDFETIATPYFAEFYYDSIFLMNQKYNSKKCLDISLITSHNTLSFQLRNILVELKAMNSIEADIRIEFFDVLFNSKLLLHSSQPWAISLSQGITDSSYINSLNEEVKGSLSNDKGLSIDVKASLAFTLSVWLLKDMITFIEVWSVTASIFDIFLAQMEVNHDKIKSEINSIYFIHSPIRQKKQRTITAEEDRPVFISLQLSSISLNIKTYYDTDSLITSLDDFQLRLLLSNHSNNVDLSILLNRIKSKRLFSSDQIGFTFQLKQNKEQKAFQRKERRVEPRNIQPEQDFELFIKKSKSMMKAKHNSTQSLRQSIFFTFTTNHINFQPLNLLSLFVAVLPQIKRNETLKTSQLSHSTKEESISHSVSSSNLMTYANNNCTEIGFDIKVNSVTFDFTKSQTSLIIALKEINLSPSCAFLKISTVDLRKEISANSKQSLISTLASISDVLFSKADIGDLDLSIGRIDIKFCKDSLRCLTEVIADMTALILVKVKEITELIASNDFRSEGNINASIANKTKAEVNYLNSSLMSLNSSFIPPLIQLNIEDNYVANGLSSKYFKLSPEEDYVNHDIKGKSSMKIRLELKDLFISLFQGEDFQSEIDYKATQIDVICSEECDDEFILVQSNQFAIKSKRELNDYLMLSMHHFELKSEIELETMNMASFALLMENLEIMDNLSTSNFKRMLSRKDIDSIGNIISASIVLRNSLNVLSVTQYCDYEITAHCSILPLSVCIDQSAMSFIISFFTLRDEEAMTQPMKESSTKQPESLKGLQQEEEEKELFYIQPPPQEMKSTFVHLNHHSKTKKEKHIFIKQFFLDEIAIDISFNYLTLSTSSNNITIPILSVEQFPFTVSAINLKGYCSPNDLASILSENLLSQLMNSKFKLLYQGIRSFNLTKPLTNFVEKFVQLFTTPYYSYRDNKGLFQGLVKGVKNFIMNIVSLNFLYGEKTVKTLTAFIGVSKSNQITKQSFYNKYILSDQQQKVNEYFYKG